MGGVKRAVWHLVVLTYGCDTCGAPPGQPCITLGLAGSERLTEVHAARSRAASGHQWGAADVPPADPPSDTEQLDRGAEDD